MSTMALLQNILKDDYGEYVESFNNDCWVLDNLANANREDFVGLRAVHAVHTKRSTGVGSRADNSNLPSAGNQTVKRIMIPMRRHYARIAITGPVMRQSTTEPGAFIAALKLEMDGVRNDYGRDLARQVWGTSNGVIATCASNSTVTVTLAAATTLTQLYQCYHEGGMAVDIGTLASPTLRTSNNIVLDYDDSTEGAYTITLTSAPGSAVQSTDFVFRAGNGGASDNSGDEGDGQIEMTGLQTAISATATLHALTVANGGKIWESKVYDNGGTNRQPLETDILKACMAGSRVSGEHVDAGVCNEGVGLSLINMVTGSRRQVIDLDSSNSGELKLQGGAGGIVITVPGWAGKNGSKLPIIFDRDCPGNALWGVHMASMKRYEHTAPHWADDDGSVLHWDGAKDRFEAFLRSFIEIGYTKRNTMWKLADLTEA